MVVILKQSRYETIFDWLDTAFKILFLIFGFLSFNSFFFGQKIMSAFVMLSTALAGILLLYRLTKWRSFVHNRYLWLLFAFLASYAVSMLLNRQYGIITQTKTMAWMGMQYVLLFATDERKNVAYYKKQFAILSGAFLVYMFAASIVSLILLFVGYGHIETLNPESAPTRVISGFVWGRLWGVFTDPNYGSVMAVIALILSLYFMLQNKKIWVRSGMAVNIVLQILYITFSDSRTGILAAAVAIGVMVFCLCMHRKMQMKTVLKTAVCLVAAAAVMFGFLTVPKGIKAGYNAAIKLKIENSINNEEENPDELAEQLAGRDQDIENDISNRRFDLWGSALEVLAARPVFGVSFNNIQPFTLENLPDNYLVNNDHGKFDNYHNVLFNIMTGQGLFGLALFVLIGACAGIRAIRHLQAAFDGPESVFYITVFCVLLAALSAAMFVSDLVYVNSPTATMFWFSLGIMLIKPEKGVS